MSPEDKALIAEAELGEEASKFLASDLYRCMIGIAEQDSLNALEGLKTVSARDAEKILQLQNQAKFGESFKAYLDELVQKGNQALLVWRERKSDGALE